MKAEMASPSSSDSPEIYWGSAAISVGNVGSKFSSKEVILSIPFICQRDPRPASFKLKLAFGIKDGKENALSAYVTNMDRDLTIKRLKFSLLNGYGQLLQTMDAAQTFSLKKGQDYGWDEFFKAANPGDVIWRFTCELEYEGFLASEPSISSSSLGEDFLKLLETAKGSDITFLVKGEKIKAHKTVLDARSTYFSSMFDSDMRENASGEIEVPDADPVAFRGMLEYLYGGDRPKNLDDVAMDLFVIADKYGIEKLREICEANIIANLDADTVVDALLLAERHNREELLSQAKVVFRAKLGDLQKSKENREKLQGHPSFLYELLVYFAGY